MIVTVPSFAGFGFAVMLLNVGGLTHPPTVHMG